MLLLARVMLNQMFVFAMQNVGDVVEAVGDTDAMLDGPSTGQLGLDENGSDGSWMWPRNERRRRGAPLIKLPLPWLQCWLGQADFAAAGDARRMSGGRPSLKP